MPIPPGLKWDPGIFGQPPGLLIKTDLKKKTFFKAMNIYFRNLKICIKANLGLVPHASEITTVMLVGFLSVLSFKHSALLVTPVLENL